MKENRLIVTYEPGEEGRVLLERMFGDSAHLVFLRDLPEAQRALELSAADVLLSWNPSRELRSEEWSDTESGYTVAQRLRHTASASLMHFPLVFKTVSNQADSV